MSKMKYFIYTAMLMPQMVYADTFKQPGTIGQQELDSVGGLTDFMQIIAGVSTGMAVVACAITLIQYMKADDSNEAADAKKRFKNILLAWIGLNIIGAILTTVFSLIGSIEV